MDLKKLQEFRVQKDSDIILLNSGISTDIHGILDLIVDYEKKRENVAVFLTTYGGLADVAYRFARTLQVHYKKYDVYILGLCKSAGTLIAIGADNIIFGERGELGPLDVQTYKPDDLLSNASGLDITEALRVIATQSSIAFDSFFTNLISGSQGTITTMTAGELSVKLTRSFIEPIAQQIDPIQLGEMSRKIKISIEYGRMLCKKFKNEKKTTREQSVELLTRNYPSHGFVIDYDEAKQLMGKCVRTANDDEKDIINELIFLHRYPFESNNAYIKFINDDVIEKNLEEEKEQEDVTITEDNPVVSTNGEQEQTPEEDAQQ